MVTGQFLNLKVSYFYSKYHQREKKHLEIAHADNDRRYQGQSTPPILSYSSTIWKQNKFRTITLLCLGLFWELLIGCEVT